MIDGFTHIDEWQKEGREGIKTFSVYLVAAATTVFCFVFPAA